MQVVPKGLAGVVVSETTASKVEGEIGHLTYRGYDIRDLAAYASYEEVAYLLLHQQLPTQQALVNLRQALAKQLPVADHFYETIHAFPKATHPLAILRTLISMLGVYDATADDNSSEADLRKAHTLMAYTPIFTAAWVRVRQNLSPIPLREDLSFAANFLYMLKGAVPTSAEISALNVYLVLMADHSLNPSTFTSRVVASTDSDLYSAITAALCALKGPKHGGANEATMQMFMEIGSPERVEEFFNEEVKTKGRKLMGFGHRVYRTTDPRGVILREQAEALANSIGEKHWFELAARLESCALADPYFTERRLFANVDYYSSVLLTNLGIAADLMPLVFAIGRMAGWITHILEQRTENRLIHPAGKYVGEDDRAWVAIENR